MEVGGRGQRGGGGTGGAAREHHAEHLPGLDADIRRGPRPSHPAGHDLVLGGNAPQVGPGPATSAIAIAIAVSSVHSPGAQLHAPPPRIATGALPASGGPNS